LSQQTISEPGKKERKKERKNEEEIQLSDRRETAAPAAAGCCTQVMQRFQPACKTPWLAGAAVASSVALLPLVCWVGSTLLPDWSEIRCRVRNPRHKL